MADIQITLDVTPVVDGLPDAETDVIVFLADDRSEQGLIRRRAVAGLRGQSLRVGRRARRRLGQLPGAASTC